MNDDYLSDLLESAGDEITVGPVPLATVHRQAAARGRRSMALTVMAAAAAVAAAIAGTVALVPDGKRTPDSLVSPKTQLAGIGHVAVAVPTSWTISDANCPTSFHDTVLLEGAGNGDCMYIEHRASVELIQFQRYHGDAQPSGTVKLVVDQHEVFGSGITCQASASPNRVVCTMNLFVPSERVQVRLSSETSKAQVLGMLTWIRILPNRSAVPPPHSIIDPQSGANYQHLLEAQGFRVVKKVEFSERDEAGDITRIFPSPGTVLKTGATVQYTVNSHLVLLSFSVANPQAPIFTLKDSRIRIAAYVTTSLGARLTLFIKGADNSRKQIHFRAIGRYLRPTAVQGALPPGVSAYAWTPITTGRTTIPIFVTEGGKKITFGYVVLRIHKSL